MSILDFFKSKDKKTPKVSGFSVSGLTSTMATSFEVFYNFYERNPYIGAVIGRIEGDVGSHGFEIRRGKTINKVADKEYRRLIKASIGYTPRQFVKRIIRDYETTGNAYVYVARDGMKATGLQILDPRYVKPIMNQEGTILGYVQNLSGIRVFLVDEVYHLRGDTDLKNESLGRSKMESLFVDLETDKEARDSNLSFFLNNQTPASIILMDSDFAMPEGEEAEARYKKEMKQVLESGKYSGGKNRHRTSIWQGVKEILKIQDRVSDMEFVETRKFTLDMVCAVYEVPKDILGMTENSNRSVGDVQTETYYFRIEEKEQLIDEFITNILQNVFGPEYSYVTLKDNVRILIIRSKLAIDLYKGKLLSLNEAREIIQYENDTRPEGNEYYQEGKSQDITAEDPNKKQEKKK